MANKHSLGKDAVTLTISKMLTLLITMVTGMLLSRFRTVAEYGTYSQMQLVVSLFVSVFMMGLPNSINYFLAKANTAEEQRKFLGVYYTLSTALSLITGAVLALVAPIISAYFKNPAILSFIYFLLLYPWASVTVSGIENVLVVYHKTRLITAYRIINSISLLGSVLLIQWLNLGFKEYIILFLAVNAALAITVYIISYKVSGGFRIDLDKSLIKKIFTFSLPIGLAAVMGTLNIEIDKLLIGFVMDTEQMAIYTNASKELPVSFISSSVTAVLLPQLTRMLKNNKNEDAITLWANATELSFMVIALIAAGVFAYAEDVITLLYSAKYLPGVSVFRVYTLVLLLRCTYFGMILNAKGQTKDIFKASVASLILNAILNPVCYMLFGMIGPAIGTFIAILTIQLWQLRQTAKSLNSSFRKVFPWKRLGLILLINCIFAILFGSLKAVLPLDKILTELGESLILGSIWTVLYLILMKKKIKLAWIGLNKENTEEK